MATTTPTVFVCGITGTQGGALARQLLALNWTIHSTVRSLDTPAAQKLKADGVKLTLGDYDDEAALKTALAGCTKLFLNMSPDIANIANEFTRGQRVLTLAKAAGITQVVYSGSVFADAPERVRAVPKDSILIAMMRGKTKIEASVAAGGFESYTLLRPCNFMANFVLPKARMYNGLVDQRRWVLAMKPTTQLPLIDVVDIAKFVAAAFRDPERFRGAGIVLASETKTPEEIVAALSAAAGKEIQTSYMSEAEIDAKKALDPSIMAQASMDDIAREFSKDKVLTWGVPMNSFEDFLGREKMAVQESYP